MIGSQVTLPASLFYLKINGTELELLPNDAFLGHNITVLKVEQEGRELTLWEKGGRCREGVEWKYR